MDISRGDGSSLQLKIAGYQFPEVANNEWDSNWLMTHLAVTLPQGSWSVTDPFLLTYEVGHLADWFDAIAAHEQTENEIGFIEPNLWFEVTNPTGGESCLRVHFGLECLPPWAVRSGRGAQDVFADFPLSEIDLHAAAESLRSQLNLYPQRAAHQVL
ncbi:MAG: hypothetical protein ACJ78Q_15915 [Chloroflexia bacterium]